MKLLFPLGRKFFTLLLLSLFALPLNAEQKDIWKKSKELKIENKNTENNKINENKNSENSDLPKTIFDKEKLNLSVNQINQSNTINDDEVIFGLYEPEDIKITLNFWSGIDQLLYQRISKNLLDIERKSFVELSEKILFTKTNINVFEDKGSKHLELIVDWLIKNKKMELIDQVIDQNKMINRNTKFLVFLFNHYLSLGQIDKACSYTKLMLADLQSVDLEKYKIFCLIYNKKNNQAQSQLELTRETASLEPFFLKTINFMIGISEKKGDPNFKNVFNSHLTLVTHKDLEVNFENFSQSKELRNYFFKSGLANKLLDKKMENSSDQNKESLNNLVIFLERSVNENLYQHEKILDIYKKYKFSFAQLFEVDEAVKNLKRPESHAILYQAMLLANDPERKLKILNEFKDKLTLNGLEKVVSPVYFSELDKIYKTKPTLINEDLVAQLSIFKRNQNQNNENFNNTYFYSSEIKKLLNKKIDKKEKKRILQILNDFDKKIKDNQYKLNNKDIAFINILHRDKIDLPNSLSKTVYEKKIYIPNEIFNSLEKKINDEALLKTLNFIGQLNDSNKDYTRDILAIIKIFDTLQLDNLKNIFIKSEFSL
ncbi:MAG: hypothetical protein VW172_03130 [Pelagibacteraceae bacterium]